MADGAGRRGEWTNPRGVGLESRLALLASEQISHKSKVVFLGAAPLRVSPQTDASTVQTVGASLEKR
jgi:hypothetical protein